MKCTKKIVITAYKVQYVDLREEKPRTPREEIYTIDKGWADAMGLLHLDITDAIRTRYERAGYKAFSIEQIKPKCVVTLDLEELYNKQVRMEQLQAFGRAHTGTQLDNQEAEACGAE